jgi:hypothetical protein
MNRNRVGREHPCLVIGVLLLSLLALSAIPALGQTFGEITGRVSDASGGAVPAATITLTNISTNAIRSTVSTDSGDYTFPSLPPGMYKIKTEHPGFKAATSNNVEVQVQQTVRLDFTLQVGQVSESIEVEAAADQLQAENGTVGTVIENKGIVQLPLNGRNYLNLVALSPNVNTLSPSAGQAGSRQGGDRANQSIAAAGQRIMYDYFTLDGVSNTDPNFNTYVVLPSIDALQEFKVQIGVYPAEFGHEATQINVLTKSGGNGYHGALFEFLRNDKLDAAPYSFTANHQAKSPFKWNDFGFELDGPIRIPKLFNGQNKLFFMANYEALRRRQNFQSTFSVPTPAMFTGNFSGLNTTIYDPTNKTPFPGNIIPSNRFDPISQKLLKYYAPANTGNGALTNNYVRSDSSPNNRDGFVLRMDFVESSKSQWSGRYSWGDENSASEGLTLDGTKILTNFEQYMGSNTRTITPNLVNEARFGYTRFFNSTGTLLAFNKDVVTEIGIPGFPGGDPVTWGIPNVTLIGYSSIGDSTEGPYANNNNTLQFMDNVSWIHGKHTLRFGAEFTRQNYNQVGNQFARGQFTFQANSTVSPTLTGGDTFADFLLGTMYQSEAAVAVANADFQRNQFHAFVDDSWKITPKLTLAMGLRYELAPSFHDTLGNLFTVNLPHIVYGGPAPLDQYPQFMRQGSCSASDVYNGIKIQWPQITTVCSNGVLNNNLMKTEFKDFAPRLSVAYSPSSNWVVRTGIGMFYNQDTGNPVFDMARNIAGRIRVVNSVAGTSNINWGNALAAIQGGAKAQVTSPFAFVDAYSHRTPYTFEYLMNVQRQIGNNWVVEFGYLGSLSRHLYGFRDANQPQPGPTALATRTPFSTFGVIQLVNDGSNAHYDSGSVKLTKRFSAGIAVITSYTYAKSIDNSSGVRVQGFDTLYPQNSNCLQCERGLSSFDTRNRFITSVIYDLPFGKGRAMAINNPVANAVLGGWQATGLWTVQSGLPQVITIGGVDRSNTGVGYDRPNATGVNPYVSSPTPSRWYDPNAYVEASAGTWGNVGRNTLVGPGIFGLDFAIHKEFRMPYKEGHSLQFRFEAFNVMNHPVWTAPNGNILAGAAFSGQPSTNAHQGFGVISGTAIPMRQVQLALKYSF